MKLLNDKKIILILFLGVVQIIASAYFFRLYVNAKIAEPLYPASQEKSFFNVSEGDALSRVSSKLEQAGLISNEFLFDYYVKKNDKETALKAGKYQFSKNMSISHIADSIILGDVYINKVKLVVPEGFNLYQIQKMLEALEIPKGKKDFQDYRVSDFKEKYAFLNNIEDDRNLEGFLFPDTYEYNKDTVNAEVVIRSMLDNFASKLTREMTDKMLADDKNMMDIVIMASILQREVITKKDMKVASGILWKRIDVGMPMQVDATMNYALNKSFLTKDDLKKVSPYNTYLNKGLPLGPISNPGVEAIEAAIFPEDSPYWFYISKKTGETVFSKTFQEHQNAINTYLK